MKTCRATLALVNLAPFERRVLPTRLSDGILGWECNDILGSHVTRRDEDETEGKGWCRLRLRADIYMYMREMEVMSEVDRPGRERKVNLEVHTREIGQSEKDEGESATRTEEGSVTYLHARPSLPC